MKFWMRISYSEYLKLMIELANFDCDHDGDA